MARVFFKEGQVLNVTDATMKVGVDGLIHNCRIVDGGKENILNCLINNDNGESCLIGNFKAENGIHYCVFVEKNTGLVYYDDEIPALYV